MRNILKFSINRKDLLIFAFLILIVSVSQFILARKHLEMGFFTDDWLFLSAYHAYVVNPFLDILQAWKGIGSHNFSYSYYIGILYNFFGLDFFSYRFTNQIFKILATLSLYPLVLYLSKRKLLAFLATFIYAIHFSSFGLLDGPSRGGNYIAITLMNLFLLTYFYVLQRKVSNIIVSLGLSVWLLIIILTGSTRLFPLVVLVFLIEIFYFAWFRNNLLDNFKRLAVIYSPFLLLFIFSPTSITYQVGYIGGLTEKLQLGNWQLFLTPFAAMGSMYIPRDFWFLFGNSLYSNFGSYLLAFLIQALIVYFSLFIFIVFFISKKPLKFIARNLLFNFIAGVIVYLIARNWLFLDTSIKTPVDPGTFLTPALIGLFIMITTFCIFLEWKDTGKRNKLLPFLFFAPVASFIFISLTWLFADINSIFMGVHAYLTISSIGVSIALAVILIIIYERMNLQKGLTKIVPLSLIVIILFVYLKVSASAVDEFFSHWIDNGLKATDQQRIQNQFWTVIGNSRNFNEDNLPLVYLDTSESKYEDGIFYSEVIVWQLASWFDLKYISDKYISDKNIRFPLCKVMILGRVEFDKYLSVEGDENGLISNKCGRNVYKKENFFAFSLKDRNLVSIKDDVLKQLTGKD